MVDAFYNPKTKQVLEFVRPLAEKCSQDKIPLPKLKRTTLTNEDTIAKTVGTYLMKLRLLFDKQYASQLYNQGQSMLDKSNNAISKNVPEFADRYRALRDKGYIELLTGKFAASGLGRKEFLTPGFSV